VAFAPGSPAHDDFRALAEWIVATQATVSAESQAVDHGAAAAAVYVADGPGDSVMTSDGHTLPRLAGTGRAAELAQRMRISGAPASGHEQDVPEASI